MTHQLVETFRVEEDVQLSPYDLGRDLQCTSSLELPHLFGRFVLLGHLLFFLFLVRSSVVVILSFRIAAALALVLIVSIPALILTSLVGLIACRLVPFGLDSLLPPTSTTGSVFARISSCPLPLGSTSTSSPSPSPS